MICEPVAQVVSLLNGAGFTAIAAQPGDGFYNAQAAVEVEAADANGIRLRITVAGNAQAGLENCTARALQILALLQGCGYACQLGRGQFDSASNLFFAVIIAQKAEPLYVKAGLTVLQYATGFSAEWNAKDGWTFRLEEHFPPGAQEESLPGNTFSLICRKDAYHNCSITSRQRIIGSQGITQIRTGTADRRTTL